MRRRFLRASLRPFVAAAGFVLAAGCAGRSTLETDVTPDAGEDAAPVVDAGTPPIETSNKVDVLFVVDNSPTTDGFHDLLASSMGYLIDRFTHPACVNGLGNVVANTPDSAVPCPIGVREFAPQTDVRFAVISTSLGGHGADLCSPAHPAWNPQQNDAAHLLTRDPANGTVPTYQNQGFLAWDPAQKLGPPGESDPAALTAKLVSMIQGTGSAGCGFESQLESVYRFLVDPEPYESIPIIDNQAVPTGVDAVVLQQRADFLRPDSAVLIVLVTDENDCSTRDGSQYFFSNQGTAPENPNKAFHLPRARSECAKNPNDPCCASCGQTTPAGCLSSSADAACNAPPFDTIEDPVNLRCFDQKRRFGIDFLQPIERYTRGLTETQVPTRDGSIVDNPLFVGNRSPRLVMMMGIVGVPWQDIAKEPKALSTGYKTVAEIDWNLVLGDATTGAPPSDPLMIESIDPRTGTSPVTGAALAPPESGPMANPINGHERTIVARDDLQYACIYPRVAPKTCTNDACDCAEPAGNPVCQSADGSYSTTQTFSKATPGTRELKLLQSLGEQGAVASVCAATASGSAQPTFGYKPAIDAALRMLRLRLE
ncbi:Hypothetical protein A7982_00356 [Minicystis rosea]|nr:Hypothetical protein A7982_00356 [Minicystis rosea]